MEEREEGRRREGNLKYPLFYLLILPKEHHGGGQMVGAFVRYSSRN